MRVSDLFTLSFVVDVVVSFSLRRGNLSRL